MLCNPVSHRSVYVGNPSILVGLGCLLWVSCNQETPTHIFTFYLLLLYETFQLHRERNHVCPWSSSFSLHAFEIFRYIIKHIASVMGAALVNIRFDFVLSLHPSMIIISDFSVWLCSAMSLHIPSFNKLLPCLHWRQIIGFLIYDHIVPVHANFVWLSAINFILKIIPCSSSGDELRSPHADIINANPGIHKSILGSNKPCKYCCGAVETGYSTGYTRRDMTGNNDRLKD